MNGQYEIDTIGGISLINYPLASSTWDDNEITAMKQVIDSGNFTMGVKVSEFEMAFAEHVGSRYCVMVNSGSSANLLATACLFYRSANRLLQGDEVIVPAVSWSTTYYPLYQYGLNIKFVDIDLRTLNYDLNALGRAVTDKTRVIVAVNLLGNPNEFSKIVKIINGKNIVLLEDNCESMGAVYNGKQTGTFGEMGTFSTFFSHHISTMEGGMIVTDNEELYHILLSLRAHGWTRNLPAKNHVTGNKSENNFEESWRFVLPGYNVRPTELNGAIGLEQIKKLPNFIKVRRENALIFQETFGNNQNFSIQRETGDSSWFGFALIIKSGSPLQRNPVVDVLLQNGIECRPIVGGNFVKNPVIKWFKYEIFETLDNSERIDKFGFFVGNHHFNLSNQIKKLHKILQLFGG